MYTAFAFLQIVVAFGCMFTVSRSTVQPFWTTLTFVLTGLVFFGAGLRIALDVFRSDFAFYMFSVVFPYASAAMVALLMVTAMMVAYRALAGQKL